MKPLQLRFFAFIIGAVVLAIDFSLGVKQAALLFNLAVLTAMVHGCIALVAVVELAKGKWVQPVKKYLLSVYPLFLLIAFLFLFLLPKWDMYGKAAGKIPGWMNEPFFFARNIGVLLLSFVMGWLYSRESLNEGPRKPMLGIFYVITFVVTNSMIAFDWVMPLEYPWYSTLFGGFFFIESLYTGLMVSAFCCFFLYKSFKGQDIPPAVQKAQYDTGILLFGFGVLWCYLFFSQLVVQWYGNLPLEVSFFTKRVWGDGPGNPSKYWPLSIAVVLIMFVFPFTILQFKKIKSNPRFVTPIALVLFCGFLLERFLILVPNVKISLPALVLELCLLLFLFGFVIRSRTSNGEEASKTV